jgi:hypothetical protein
MRFSCSELGHLAMKSRPNCLMAPFPTGQYRSPPASTVPHGPVPFRDRPVPFPAGWSRFAIGKGGRPKSEWLRPSSACLEGYLAVHMGILGRLFLVLCEGVEESAMRETRRRVLISPTEPT